MRVVPPRKKRIGSTPLRTSTKLEAISLLLPGLSCQRVKLQEKINQLEGRIEAQMQKLQERGVIMFDSAKSQVRFVNPLLLCACSLCWLAGCSPPPATNQPQPEKTTQQQPPQPQAQTQAAQGQDEEVQMGQEVFNELKAKGVLIQSSPLYDQLRPISDEIARAAQPQYEHPFKFYLVHDAQPNAFATPGGNVYVVDSLLYFVKNKEQLAGTLCHEVSHTIHHDTMELMEKRQKLERREVGAALLLGPTKAHLLAIALIGHLNSLGYSRDVEERADITGSDICARTSYNPWGLVWLLHDFENSNLPQVPQLLSDHPNDQNRINALERHFRKDPTVFAKFNPDPKSATPMTVPKDSAEVFVH